MTEAFIVSLLAGIVGYAIGIVSPRFVAPYLMSAYNLTFEFDPVLAAGAIVASVVVGLAGEHLSGGAGRTGSIRSRR